MQNLGRVTIKRKIGGGLNVLCYALAGYVVAKTIEKLDHVLNRAKRDEALKEAVEAVKTMSDVIDLFENLDKDIEDEEDES